MMSRHGAVELDFAGAERTFRLGLSQIEELEEKAGQGIFQIMESLSPQNRTVRAKVISEVIRIGLIGGGTQPADALSMVRRYCDERPMLENLMLAYAVVVAGITRVNGTVAEKLSGEPQEAAMSEPTSPPSTQPVS